MVVYGVFHVCLCCVYVFDCISELFLEHVCNFVCHASGCLSVWFIC